MRKAITVLAAALAFSVLPTGTALAAWESDDRGWRYQYDDGSYAGTGAKDIGGQTYYFDADGYMLTGFQYLNWKWYYFDANGVKQTGWVQVDGKWYYMDPKEDGAMHTYWLDLPDAKKKGKTNRYYLDENGVLQTGIFYLSPEMGDQRYAYQADENGVLIRNKYVKEGDMEIRYGEDGTIRYRNAETKRQAKRDGSDEWQYMLSENEINNIKSDQVEDDDYWDNDWDDDWDD